MAPQATRFLELFYPQNPRKYRKFISSEKKITVDGPFVSKYFIMSDEVIHRLTRFFSIPRKLEPVKVANNIDRYSLAIRYRELIQQGYVKKQADLARHLGVSGDWITKVKNELKQVSVSLDSCIPERDRRISLLRYTFSQLRQSLNLITIQRDNGSRSMIRFR